MCGQLRLQTIVVRGDRLCDETIPLRAMTLNNSTAVP
jgi:hypothetical protein